MPNSSSIEHPYPRERTWPDAEAELAQATTEIERLRELLEANRRAEIAKVRELLK